MAGRTSSAARRVFFLERAAEDSVTPLGAGESVVGIYQSVKQIMGAYWQGMPLEQKRRLAALAFDNAMAKAVPAFRLQFTLTGRFLEHRERALALILN